MGFTTCVEASVTSFTALLTVCVWQGKFGKSFCGGIFVLMCSSTIGRVTISCLFLRFVLIFKGSV